MKIRILMPHLFLIAKVYIEGALGAVTFSQSNERMYIMEESMTYIYIKEAKKGKKEKKRASVFPDLV